MNWEQFAGQWAQMKGKIKEKWGELTDDDLDVINGRKDQFVGKLQERYGIVKAHAQRELDMWLKAPRLEEESRRMQK